MNYIYDIMLNFNHQLYPFYEWYESDKIINIKKIPIFLVTSDVLTIISRDDIHINDIDFMKKINDKTEVFNPGKNISIIGYACLLTDGIRTIGLKINKAGRINGKSTMIFDEEEETIEMAQMLGLTDLKYRVIKIKDNTYEPRYQFEYRSFIKNELTKAYMAHEQDKLKYLYYEIFNKYCNNMDNIFNVIMNTIKEPWSKMHENIYDIMKLSYIKK